MKKMFLMIILFVSVGCYSQKNDVSDKRIKEIFADYKSLPKKNENYAVFWDFMKENSREYNKFLNDDSKMARNIKSEYRQLSINLNIEMDFVLDESSIRLSQLFCGDNYSDYIKGIVSDNSEELNACVYPNGLIFLSKGMERMLEKEGNTAGFMGVIAHEITHNVLKHGAIHKYSLKKKEKSNNLKNIIAQSLTGVAVAGAQLAHASSGATYSEEHGQQYESLLNNSLGAIDRGFAENTYRYKFAYGREQELEADIGACLFLLWIGENPNFYIDALKSLQRNKANYILTYDSTHPTIGFRINMLTKYFLEAELYTDETGKITPVPKCKLAFYKHKYPKSKKVKKEIYQKYISENSIFLSEGKFYSVPCNKIDLFKEKRMDAQRIEFTY